jgi:integrase
MTTRSKYVTRKADPKTPGKFWNYFRAKGVYTRLPDDPASAEFAREYNDCLATLKGLPLPGLRTKHDRRPRDLPEPRRQYPAGSIGWLIPHYVSSATWEAYSDGTRMNCRRALGLLRAQIGDVLITDLDASRVDHYTHKIERRYGGAVADQQKALISNLWEEAKDHAEIDRKGKINPTLDTKVRYRVKKTTKAWSAEAHEAFLATARSTLTLAADLLYFTGQRGGDATKVRWSDISEAETDNGKRWFLRVVQQKTGKALWHQLPEPLAERLRHEPHISKEFVLTNAWKRPWASASVLSHAITRHFRKLGITGFTMHGLRAAAARDIASIGGGTDGVKSITGHVSDKLARQYAEDYDQRRVNSLTVEAWNADLRRKASSKQVATPEERRRKLRIVG